MVDNAQQIRIVVVDDHPVVRDGVATMIESQADMKLVGEGDTAHHAITLVEQLFPDILLLDLRLPDGDGIQVVEELKARGVNTRTIILTTYPGDVPARRSLEAGAFGYLLKATLRRDLRICIREVHAGSKHIQTEVALELAKHASDQMLTPREIDVLRLVAGGCSNKLTADRLSVREDTVKKHLINIFAKLQASDRAHAVTIAMQRGFLQM